MKQFPSVIQCYYRIEMFCLTSFRHWKFENFPPRVTYVAGIQTGAADQSGPHGDKELLAGQAGELEKPKGWIRGAKILCANNTKWDQAPVCQRSVRGSFADWAPCFWHCVSVEGQIFTENFTFTMCFRFVRSFVPCHFKTENDLSTLRPQQDVQHQGSCCEDGKPKENPPAPSWWSWMKPCDIVEKKNLWLVSWLELACVPTEEKLNGTGGGLLCFLWCWK